MIMEEHLALWIDVEREELEHSRRRNILEPHKLELGMKSPTSAVRAKYHGVTNKVTSAKGCLSTISSCTWISRGVVFFGV